MVIHVHHKSVHSEGSDEFKHLARIQKILPEGSDFDYVFSYVSDTNRVFIFRLMYKKKQTHEFQ